MMTRSLILAALWCGPLAAACAAGEWKVAESDSRIGFVATYDDIPFDARFDDFEARIRFSPDELDDAVFDIRIDVSSLDSNSADRDDGMKQDEWFATEAYPVARFRAERFERIDEDRYRAIGKLSLKDAEQSIEVPFTWEPQPSGGAVITAETELERGDFNIGTGEWAEDDIIGFDVTVKARLVLSRD